MGACPELSSFAGTMDAPLGILRCEVANGGLLGRGPRGPIPQVLHSCQTQQWGEAHVPDASLPALETFDVVGSLGFLKQDTHSWSCRWEGALETAGGSSVSRGPESPAHPAPGAGGHVYRVAVELAASGPGSTCRDPGHGSGRGPAGPEECLLIPPLPADCWPSGLGENLKPLEMQPGGD